MGPKGFAPVVILLIIGGLLAVAGVWYATHQLDMSSQLPGNRNIPVLSAVDTSNSSTVVVGGTLHWKTYRNDRYGFSIKYASDQPDPRIVTNSTSAIYSSAVAETGFILVFNDNSIPFHNPVYDPSTDSSADLAYSTSSKEWIITTNSGNSICPAGRRTKQGVPFYSISTGFHAGDTFDAYVTKNGILAVAQGMYFAEGKVWPDEVTFDDPASVFELTCRVVPPATSDYRIGYIKSIASDGSWYYATIQAIDFVKDANAPDGYRIINHPDEVQTFPISESASITLISDTLASLKRFDVVDQSSNLPSMTLPFAAFESSLEAHGYTWDSQILLLRGQPYNFSFQNGVITKIDEQYVP